MPDVKKIVKSLNDIGKATYKGSASSRPTLHQQNFDRLQASAKQVAAILSVNPNPNRDSRENIDSQFAAMKKSVDVYCTKTAGTEDVLSAWNKAYAEWQLFVGEQ
ncbi:MAG: hypothetical protein IPH26_08740 [Sterolibacteriaceae bacterium]|uniref:Uncharacterized protein n=1 Tax=Candidatus Methylophosphatis roskildensis TaxID=2899263 RepID=A0A9D7DY88_9PROT|nr:hypothetical protein [Candidatus Methylophosphatis roskildensis]MBK7237575.1 hypothetical protein [Sterolibacteriaceae bacterium]